MRLQLIVIDEGKNIKRYFIKIHVSNETFNQCPLRSGRFDKTTNQLRMKQNEKQASGRNHVYEEDFLRLYRDLMNSQAVSLPAVARTRARTVEQISEQNFPSATSSLDSENCLSAVAIVGSRFSLAKSPDSFPLVRPCLQIDVVFLCECDSNSFLIGIYV